MKLITILLVLLACHQTFSLKNTKLLEKVIPSRIMEDGVSHENIYFLVRDGQFANITSEPDSVVICYPGKEPGIFSFWSSVTLKIELPTSKPPPEYRLIKGNNVTEVKIKVVGTSGMTIINMFPPLPWDPPTQTTTSPFRQTCLGVSGTTTFVASLDIREVDFVLVLTTLAGMFLFRSAPNLARSSLIHYTTGVTAGVVLSLLLITYMIQRRLKQSMMSWVIVLYSLSLYTLTNIWLHLTDWLTDHNYLPWLTGYIIMSGFISWVVMYRWGLPTDPRTLNLIQWSLQLSGLLVVVCSSHHQQASLALALVMLVWLLVPDWIKSRASTQVKRRLFITKVKLLSEAEYQAQTNEETKRALEELRRYCQSPKCQPWPTVSRLASPKRFASFIEGSPHLSEEEVMEYSTWDEDSFHSEQRYSTREGIDTSEDTNITDTSEDTNITDTSEDTNISDEDLIQVGHRFSCVTCNKSLQGHRFTCLLCK